MTYDWLIESVLRDATITVEAQSLLPALESISCRWKLATEHQKHTDKQNTELRARVDELEKENDRLSRALAARK